MATLTCAPQVNLFAVCQQLSRLRQAGKGGNSADHHVPFHISYGGQMRAGGGGGGLGGWVRKTNTGTGQKG